MEITRRQWLIAVLIAGLAHVALVLALMYRSAPPPESRLGMTIELGAGGQGGAGGAPGADALQPVVGPTLAVKPAHPAPVTVSSLVPEAAPAHPIVAKAQPEPTPESTPTPKPESQQPSAASTQPNQPKQPSESRVEPKQDSAKPSLQSQNRTRAGGRDEGGRERPNGTTASSGGSGGEIDASNYYGRLATWLARHKRYPTQAQRLRQEGTVKVTFTVDNNGRVISQRITESSGYELLDHEAQAMLERASPLPRIPASLGRSRITITLPVDFTLR